MLLLPLDKPPELVDLKRDSPPASLPEIGSSTNAVGFFGTNTLCQWNGSNQFLVHEWRGTGFIQQGAISLDSGSRPKEFSYNPTRQLLAWTEGTAWQKGGALAWQVFDKTGTPTAEKGRTDGVPVWSLPSAYCQPDGRFVIVY